MANLMRKRAEYEEIFHTLITQIFPRMPKSNIRSTFNENDEIVGEISLTGNYEKDGVKGYTNVSNFIYFTLIFDETIYTHEYLDGTIDANRSIKLDISIYGKDGHNLALIMEALIRSNYISTYINRYKIYLNSSGKIIQFNEAINGQYWERRDIVFDFNEAVDITSPVPIEEAKDGEVKLINEQS